MVALYLIGGALIIAGILFAVVWFTQHVKKTYGYNVFNAPNLLMLGTIFVIWVIVLVVAVTTEDALDPLNYRVCGFATIAIWIVMFIRNLKHTSLPVATGALGLQIAATGVILMVVILTFVWGILRRSEKGINI